MLSEQTEEAKARVIRSARGNACCKRLFGRSTDRASRVPASIQFWPPPTSPRERSTTTSTARKPWDMPSSKRSSQNLPATGGCVLWSAARTRPIDALIGIVRAIPVRPERRKGRLSSAQSGAGDVSAGRAIPQTTGDDIPRLAGRSCLRFAERAVPRNGSPRPGSQTRLPAFWSRWSKATTSLAKNAQDAKVWEVGIRNIVGWLKSLRAPRQSRRGGRRMSKKHVVRQRQRF